MDGIRRSRVGGAITFETVRNICLAMPDVEDATAYGDARKDLLQLSAGFGSAKKKRVVTR